MKSPSVMGKVLLQCQCSTSAAMVFPGQGCFQNQSASGMQGTFSVIHQNTNVCDETLLRFEAAVCQVPRQVCTMAQDVRQTLHDELVELNPDKDWSFVTRQIGAPRVLTAQPPDAAVPQHRSLHVGLDIMLALSLANRCSACCLILRKGTNVWWPQRWHHPPLASGCTPAAEKWRPLHCRDVQLHRLVSSAGAPLAPARTYDILCVPCCDMCLSAYMWRK